MADNRREFSNLLLEAVEEALSILGETARDAIFFFIKEEFNLRREEIPRNPEKFSNALKAIFGDAGCFLLEEQILYRLYARLGLTYHGRLRRSFSECISIAYELFHKE